MINREKYTDEKLEAIHTTLWNERADLIQAQNCPLASQNEFKKEIEALNFVLDVLWEETFGDD